MDQPPRQINAVGGIFAALIFLFVVGFLIGLPIWGWVLLMAAFIGLWAATAGKRAEEKATEQPLPDRPWRANRNAQQ